ncbi:hypothetical protein U0070_021469, partial [Myodes glareolus]
CRCIVILIISPFCSSSSTVCRDFAVLEDHTLAHSLQEQEIEHHLASNIQRNRLVQHDLQVAKQLQEEDLKAQAQLQKRYKDLEQHDCEIAQEIQEKLTIEAERRRIQEKKDEDIARLLQEKELQEEKKRKKHIPEPSGGRAFGDNYYHEDGGNSQCLCHDYQSLPQLQISCFCWSTMSAKDCGTDVILSQTLGACRFVAVFYLSFEFISYFILIDSCISYLFNGHVFTWNLNMAL